VTHDALTAVMNGFQMHAPSRFVVHILVRLGWVGCNDTSVGAFVPQLFAKPPPSPSTSHHELDLVSLVTNLTFI